MAEPQKTSPVQFRLTDEDRREIEVIRRHFGLPSAAAAVRYAVHRVRQTILEPDQGPEKGPEKKSG